MHLSGRSEIMTLAEQYYYVEHVIKLLSREQHGGFLYRHFLSS